MMINMNMLVADKRNTIRDNEYGDHNSKCNTIKKQYNQNMNLTS